jgi:hypothetical protein
VEIGVKVSGDKFLVFCKQVDYELGRFSITRICSHTWIWPACVVHAKNNFICESIVKRDKRTRDAGRCAGRYPGAGHPHA